jgi:hypothetical protein
MAREAEIAYAVDAMTEVLLARQRVPLAIRIAGAVAKAYLLADVQVVRYVSDELKVPAVYEGPPMLQAIRYAQQLAARLITQMDEETKAQIRQLIAEAIRGKKGVEGLATDLRKLLTDMSVYRSRLIARTETCDALEQAFMDRSRAMGVTGKAWVTYDPCEICRANEEEGDVPLEHTFSSGHIRPPAHPNCRCALAPVMLPTTQEAS